METSRRLYFFSVLVGFFFTYTSAETCKMTGPCTCEFEQWKIDLSPLVPSSKNSEPMFTVSAETYIFSYNPCKPFRSNATNCKNDTDLAVNRIDKGGKCLVIGNQENVAFKGDTSKVDGIYLEYSNKKGAPNSFAKVLLQCSNQNHFKYIKQETPPPLSYVFKLETIYACQPVNHKLSAGSIFLILFMVATTVYLIGGFIFKHFYLHAQGVEIIPHYSFWSDFPLLVRDGCYFTFHGCQGPTTYERI